MPEEADQLTNAEEEPSLRDTIFMGVGMPERIGEITALFALQAKTLAILKDAGIITTEQAKEIVNHAQQRVVENAQRVRDKDPNDKVYAEVADNMENEPLKWLKGVRERVGILENS